MQLIIDMGNTQPKYPINLTVYPDGKALMTSGADVHEVGVKTLGEHGELIDADAFKIYLMQSVMKFITHPNYAEAKKVTEDFCLDIDEQPTILEATK